MPEVRVQVLDVRAGGLELLDQAGVGVEAIDAPAYGERDAVCVQRRLHRRLAAVAVGPATLGAALRTDSLDGRGGAVVAVVEVAAAVHGRGQSAHADGRRQCLPASGVHQLRAAHLNRTSRAGRPAARSLSIQRR